MTKTNILFGCLVLFSGSAVLAQSVPNPLVRPAPPQVVSPARMPPMPPGDFGAYGGAGDSGKAADKADERIKAAQSLLSRYAVVAIQGDMAILRQATAAAASGAGGLSNSSSVGLPGFNPGGSTSATSQSGSTSDLGAGVMPSLLIKHKEELAIQDVVVIPDIRNGQVVLRTAEGKRAVFSGRLDGNSMRTQRGISWQAVDSAYTARQSPPISKAAGSATAGNTSNGAGSANQFGNLNTGNSN